MRLPVVALVLLGLTAVGCTNRDLMEARAANAQMQRKLQQSEEARKSLEGDNQKLQRGLAAQVEAEEARKKENDLLRTQCAQLKDSFDNLNKLYQEELKRKDAPPIGPLLPTGMDRALKALAAANPDLFTYDSKLGMVKLKSDLSFASGSAVVQPGASQALGKLVAILKTPEAGTFHVYVAGHTDDVPIGNPETRKRHPTNWYLSVHRAIGVQKVLVKAGMPDARIGVMGFGEFHPIAPNKPNKKGNAANRRVELWILPPGRLLTRPAGGEAPK